MGDSNSGDEAYHLLADTEGAESAEAAVEYVRHERRLRGEPTMSRKEALRRANEHLRSDGSAYVADAGTALPNGLQDLWVVSYYDPAHPGVVLSGGGLVVSSAGDVYPLSSVPGQSEMIGVQIPPNDEEAWMLPEGWDDVLGETLRAPEWSKLIEFVDGERENGTVCPSPDQVFRAFELTPYDKVRVVILGQDPYHGKGQAQGLSFSVAHGKIPPSLRKILKELERDPGVVPHQDGNLESWARQGVLLLNTVLTVRAGSPNSHRGNGWEAFTDAVIRAVNKKSERVVFLLWGAPAQKKKDLVTNPKHHVISAAHPAARANALNPLFGSKSFSRTNEALIEAKQASIAWGLPIATADKGER
jgi:uracil-DNA glycosylase